MIEDYDDLIIRCGQLGGEVPFKYCRVLNEGLPCRRIILCWEFRMDIGPFLSQYYTPDQLRKVLAPPSKTRVETIVELIERAKKVKEHEGEEC
ncbi:MAG: hypothetical protein N3G78_04295 [Desulfobacterota bacterium]|nr:hypothetical protein [Thermodesulfobacteriota bacterium]